MNTLASFVTGKQKAQVTDRFLSRPCILEKMRSLTALTRTGFSSFKTTTPKANKLLSSLIMLDHVLDRTGHGRVFIAESEMPVGLIVERFGLRECLPSRSAMHEPGAN